tara:strand:+ start:185 stop:595 length:411 start_codon:yes stop_codon:yes gene_type:complete
MHLRRSIMGWRNSYIEVTTEIDLNNYDDEIMEYVEPDNISDALDMMEGWGYTDGDILNHMMEDPSAFLEKVSSILTVETALELVKNVYEYGHGIMAHNLTVRSNQIDELREKIRQLENPTTTEETTDESRSTDRTA